MDKVKYWIDIADYDYATACDLMKSRRWIYVAFMCHQTIEKTLKAYWTATQPEDPPYTHNLVLLADKTGLAEMLCEEQNVFISQMMPLNIQARYPSYKEQLSKKLNKDTCRMIIDKTKELQSWIKSKL